MNLTRSICGLLSFLMLMHCTVNRQGTENRGLSYGDYVQDMQRRGRLATAKKYIYNDLLKNHDILPTASAIEMIYTLNPQLAQMSSIPENYKLILPQRPPVKDRKFINMIIEITEGQDVTEINKKLLQTELLFSEQLNELHLEFDAVSGNGINIYFSSPLRYTFSFKNNLYAAYVEDLDLYLKTLIKRFFKSNYKLES